MTSAIAVAVLVIGGVYLVLQRGLLRVVLGFVLLGHAANLVLLAAGGTDRREPPFPVGEENLATMADPLPQAFVLTAIVIAFAITIYLVSLAGAGGDAENAHDASDEDDDGAESPADGAALRDPVTEGAGDTADDDPRVAPIDDRRRSVRGDDG